MQISPKSIGASQLTMLLSFERPARRRRLGVSRPRPPGAERLFADLENCTVANEIGYQGEDFGLHFGEAISLGRRSRLYRGRIVRFPQGNGRQAFSQSPSR